MAMVKKPIAASLVFALALPSVPLAAQQAGDAVAAAQPYGPVDSQKSYESEATARKCTSSDPQRPSEIIVCGTEDDAEFRVKPTSDLDPESKEALDDGLPRAPNVFGIPPCVPSLISLCAKMGGPGRAAYMIDFDELPDAPPGSDADKISKGEKSPR